MSSTPVRILDTDQVDSAIRDGATLDELLRLIFGEPAQSVDAALMLDDIVSFIRRFVSLSPAQACVIALWVGHTHCFSAFDVTPYLSITSAEMQCGKTRLLEILELLVFNPWRTGRGTAAVLIRKIDAERSTVLLDEADAAFGGGRGYTEMLRGLLNTGYERGGVYSSCVGQDSFKDFSTFCPKAVAGIGALPSTIASRSISIRMKRAARDEHIERFRRRTVEAEANVLREKLAAWATVNIENLRAAQPALPDALDARQADCVEPLIAIADLAGGEWPEAARGALVTLCVAANAESIGVQLLTDIREIFQDRGVDRLASAELVTGLVAVETSPWAEFGKAEKPITAAKLAQHLRHYGITPHNMRIGDQVLKSYALPDFGDAFERYLRIAGQDATTLQDAIPATTAAPQEACSGVAATSPVTGMGKGEPGGGPS